MGKITGLMDYERIEEGWACHRALSENYKEFRVYQRTRSGSQKQSPAGLRHAAFCNNGCPVNNIIPLQRHGVPCGPENAIHTLHSTNNLSSRPHLPGALRKQPAC
jgi:glutamate synthase (NADPH/NADH) small chain